MKYPDKLKIVVDFFHIGKGRQCSRTHGPIALALRERFPKARIIVNSHLHLERPGIILGDAFYPHTEESKAYIEQIDDPHVFTYPNVLILWKSNKEENK